MRCQFGAQTLDLIKDASCSTASSDRQRGVRRTGRLFDLSVRQIGHCETAQRSSTVPLVDRRQRPKGALIQRDRLLRLACRQPAARTLDLDMARCAVRAMTLVGIAYGIACRPGVRLVQQPL